MRMISEPRVLPAFSSPLLLCSVGKNLVCCNTLIDSGPPGPNGSPPVSSPAPSGDPANQPPSSAGGNKPGGMIYVV